MLPGTVQAWYEAPIYARVNGYLKKWNFDYGAHVKKGDVLAEIETPDLDAQLAASQAKLNSARAVVKVREAEEQFAQSTYQRWRDSPKGVVSVQEQESKQADYNSAKARLSSANAEVAVDQGEVDRLQRMESFKNITAPFDGVVTARETDVGALINAGSGTGGGNGPELFRVADIHMMRIYVQVPQQLSAGIKAGLTAELQLPQYPEQDFQGDRRHHLERDQSRTPERFWSSSMPTIRMASCSLVPMPRSISSCRATPTSSASRPARSSSASTGWRSQRSTQTIRLSSADKARPQSRNRGGGGARTEALGPAGQQPARFARNRRQGPQSPARRTMGAPLRSKRRTQAVKKMRRKPKPAEEDRRK